MTITTDRADSGEIKRPPADLGGDPTRNLASYMLRQGEVYSRHRLAAADTMIVRTDLTADPNEVAAAKLRAEVAAAGLRAGEPFIGNLCAPSARDAWITSGEIPPYLTYALTFTADGLQEPPTGNPPPLPPHPPTPAKAVPRVRFRHRRRLAPVAKAVLWTALVGSAMWAGLILAAVAVFR